MYLLGGYSGRHDFYPFPFIQALKNRVSGPEADLYTFDKDGRLASGDQKKVVACPHQTERTAVLLLAGQSNAGNHAGQRFRSEHGDRIVNFFNGQCYFAASPLLGSDGSGGEYWTHLSNLLLDRNLFEEVVLAPVAISGSAIARWAQGGDLHGMMIEAIDQLLSRGYLITHVLWVQGEIDYVRGTGEIDYRDWFISMVKSLRTYGLKAPIYVGVASKCLGASNGGTRFHSADNPVVRAQQGLPDPGLNLRSGVNSDALLGDLDRYDDCHFGASGEEKVAEAWADRIAAAH
jgi:hypothetical protein